MASFVQCYTIQKYLVLFGCMLISFTIGSVFSFGNLSPYFASYLAYKNGAAYKQYEYQINNIYCLLIIFQSVSMAFCNRIYLVFGFQRSCLLGCFIVSFGIGLTYFACDNLFLSCLTYGIMFGIGSGIVYPTLIVCCLFWWTDRKHLVVSIISGCYGCGAFIFIFIQTLFINPENLRPTAEYGYVKHTELMYNFPDIFVWISMLFSLMQVIGILCLRNPSYRAPPENDAEFRHYTYSTRMGNSSVFETPNNEALGVQDNNCNQSDFTIAQCLHCLEFWKLFIVSMLHIVIYLFVVALYQQFSLVYLGMDNPLYLSVIGAVSCLFHGVFRFLYPYYYDYCQSFVISNATTSIILTCFVGTLSLCQYAPNAMMFLWCIVLFSCLGSIYTFIPKCVVANTRATKPSLHCHTDIQSQPTPKT